MVKKLFMKRVGITGGIGSGKSTVCMIFEQLGIPVYYADQQAKWLMVHDESLREAIAALLGAEAYLPQGQLNSRWIASRVFQHPALLEQLNALVHPAVAAHSEQWHLRQSSVPYTLYEAALLYESGGYKKMDCMITVTAPLPTRIERVMLRDQCSREEVEARIARQMPEGEKVARADFVIVNDGQQSLVFQVLQVHHSLFAPEDKNGRPG